MKREQRAESREQNHLVVVLLHDPTEGVLPLWLHKDLLDLVDPAPDAGLLPELPGRVEEAVGGEEDEHALGHQLDQVDDGLSEGVEVLGVGAGLEGGVEGRLVRTGSENPAPHLAGSHHMTVF